MLLYLAVILAGAYRWGRAERDLDSSFNFTAAFDSVWWHAVGTGGCLAGFSFLLTGLGFPEIQH